MKTKKGRQFSRPISSGKKGSGSKKKKQCPQKCLVGVVQGSPRGFSFLKVDGFEKEVYLPQKSSKGAMHGDEVEIVLKGQEAFVIKIRRRHNQLLTGRFFDGGTGKCYVTADEKRFYKHIEISGGHTKAAKTGQKVAVRLTFQPENNDLPLGIVEQVFSGTDEEIYQQTIRFNYQISETFPEDVEREAAALLHQKEENPMRKDLREVCAFTIDGADAKDLDDAVSIIRKGDGYCLGVHIADVGHYVAYQSQLDEEAYARGTSVYFPDAVFPMLPKVLSNNLCSLNPREDKLALSVEIQLDAAGKVKNYSIFESLIQSRARLTYDEVYAAIRDVQPKKSANITDEVYQSLQIMKELSKKLGDIRQSAGALDLDLPEPCFDVDNKGNVLAVYARERNSAHKLIENFMVLANEVIARYALNHKLPFVYRVHEKPTFEKISETLSQLALLGITSHNPPRIIPPRFVQEILEKVKEKDYAETATMLLLRSLQKARYAEECLGHFGLALEQYCHFTSPIRRYPDLTIHRILKDSLQGRLTEENQEEREEFVISSSIRSSERERNADEAEREYDAYLKAKYMKNHIGEIFEGKVSGLIEFGIFVALPNTVEGLVRAETFTQRVNFDEKRLSMTVGNVVYSLGKKVKVKVANVDTALRKIDFVFCLD